MCLNISEDLFSFTLWPKLAREHQAHGQFPTIVSGGAGKSNPHPSGAAASVPPLTYNDSRPFRVQLPFRHTIRHTWTGFEKDLNSLC